MQQENKRPHERLLEKMKAAYAAEFHFEAVWLAYAVLEDRLSTALRLTGGAAYGNHRPMQEFGPKLGELNHRRERNPMLAECFSEELMGHLAAWKAQRDVLLQGMADDAAHVDELAERIHLLAQRGVALANLACLATRRLKKRRAAELML